MVCCYKPGATWNWITLFSFLLREKSAEIRECISSVLWRNLVNHAVNIHPSIFNSFHITHIYDEFHRIFRNLWSYGIFLRFGLTALNDNSSFKSRYVFLKYCIFDNKVQEQPSTYFTPIKLCNIILWSNPTPDP